MNAPAPSARPKLRKRLIIVIVAVVVLFVLLVGWNTVKGIMIGKFMQSIANPPQTVSTMVAGYQEWQPQVQAVGNVRAVQGADLAFDVAGLVASVEVKSGANVKQGQVLVQLVADQQRATLAALRANEHLAERTAKRAKRQLAVKAISQAGYDAAIADLKTARAQADAQAALVAKKTLRAPFAGRIGIITASAGQYIKAGVAVVTLQQLNPVYVDFHVAQSTLQNLHPGSKVEVTADSFGNTVFTGKITAIAPKVDLETRNVKVEATLANPHKLLIPGMFTHVAVAKGKPRRYLTLPATAVTYAPYGDTLFVVHPGRAQAQGKDATPAATQSGAAATPQAHGKHQPPHYVQQVLVTIGPRRGDQVAIVKGIQQGDVIVTSGGLKLKNGTPVNINNKVQPAFDPHPHPVEQ